MTHDDSFDEIMARLRAGEEDAAVAIFQRFTRRLVVLSRTQLESMARTQAEVEDVVQSVYKSFFARYGRGEYEFDDWGDIWGLLTIITVRKCANRRTYHRARRRDARREVAWQRVDDPGNLVDREPTPLEAATLADMVQELFRGMDQPDRETVSLLLQGYTAEEIAATRSCSERTVRRVRGRLKNRLKRLHAGDP